MINELLERGFHQVGKSNEYVKEDWTVRLEKDTIEVFNNPDKAAGYYYCAPIKKVDIETLLDEIDEFILD